jgi:hypothetical protein
MKKLKLLLLLLGVGLAAISQVNIVSFTVKNTLPATIDSWLSSPGALVLIAQKAPGQRLVEPRLVVQIRSGSAVICGNNAGTGRPVDPFDVRTFSTADITGILSGCQELKAGSYSICAQFFNADGKEISKEVCKEFRVEGAANTEYAPPALISPDNDKKFKLLELQRPVVFRWTPLVPKPREPVTYRLKVWQLMSGQNGTQAMRSNQPIVTKDVDNLTQATVNGIITGPCRPPYLCEFIWSVQALSRNGKPMGNNDGNSEPYTFKMLGNDIDIQYDSVYVSCCNSNGTQSIYVKIKNNLANTVKITQLNIDKVNGVANVIPIIGLTPGLIATIPGNGSQVFTGTIKCIDTATTIRFFVRAEDAADNAITETEVETDTLDCPCDPCRTLNIKVEKDSLVIPKNGNPVQVNLIGSFTGLNPNLIKKVTAEIIYFNITQTKDTNCAKCVFDSKHYGNFYPPASALPGYTGPVFNKPDYSRLVTWNSTIIKDCGGQPHGGGDGTGTDHGGGVEINNPTYNKALGIERQTPKRDFGEKVAVIPDNNNPQPPVPLPNFILPIAVPEMSTLSCCGDVIKICIRYTYYDFCCHACEVIKCYEIKREK